MEKAMSRKIPAHPRRSADCLLLRLFLACLFGWWGTLGLWSSAQAYPFHILQEGLLGQPAAKTFISTWNTFATSSGSSNFNQIRLPLVSNGFYDFQVDWGDGTVSHIRAYDDAFVTHTYTTGGTYTLRIGGTIIGWQFNNTGDRLKLTSISQWGSLRLGNATGYFFGASNLTVTATDILDLRGTTNLSAAFRACSSLTSVPNMGSWDTSQVTDMSLMFSNAFNFNQPLNTWNVSSVTDMTSMFSNAHNFDQNLSSWDIRNVTAMTNFLVGGLLSPTNYNALLTSWSSEGKTGVTFSAGQSQYTDTASASRASLASKWTITDGGITAVGPTGTGFISTWKTDYTGSSASNQITLPLVSNGTYTFTVDWGDGSNDTITAWNSAFKTHTYASAGIYTITIIGTIIGWSFNNTGDAGKLLNISQWGPLAFGNTSGQFYGASRLNITATDAPTLTGTTSFQNLFRDCGGLSTVPGIGTWNVSAITNMNAAFYSTITQNGFFNENISSWNTANVTNMGSMLQALKRFNQPIGTWNVAKVTSMANMFTSDRAFNQDLSNWNVGEVTSFGGMFDGASVFNGNIGTWNTAKVTSYIAMLRNATNFNQNLGSWNVTAVTNSANMSNMLTGTGLTPVNYDAILIGWATQNVTSGISFASPTYYTAAASAARATLTTKGWTISDLGQAP